MVRVSRNTININNLNVIGARIYSLGVGGGKLGITPLLARLNRIPQLLSVMELVGHILRRQYLGMNNASLAAKIVMAI